MRHFAWYILVSSANVLFFYLSKNLNAGPLIVMDYFIVCYWNFYLNDNEYFLYYCL